MKNLFLITLLVFGLNSFGQTSSGIIINEIKFQTDTVEELMEIEWSKIREIMTYSSEKEIDLILVYANANIDKPLQKRLDRFELKFTISEDAFDEEIEKIKYQLQKLLSFKNKIERKSL